MLFTSTDELRENAQLLYASTSNIAECEIIDTKTVIGGGTTPNRTIPSVALSMKIKNYKPAKMEKLFRAKKIIGRIEDDKFLIDFRAINKNEIAQIIQVTKEIADV